MLTKTVGLRITRSSPPSQRGGHDTRASFIAWFHIPHSELILELRMLPVQDELGNEGQASLTAGCVL
jgi:hypothetical protein